MTSTLADPHLLIHGRLPPPNAIVRRVNECFTKPQKGYFMRCCWLFMALMFWVIGPAVADQTPFDPSSFHTNATFSVDSDVMSLTSAVATIKARPNAPGYSWLRISFYSFPPAAEDIASVVSGNVESLDRKWSKKASNPKDYNHSHAVLQLSVDKGQKISQVDMSVPGHACTIAPFEQDIKNAWQTYHFDGKHLRLKSKGSYICDMKFMGIPNQKFGWDVDLNLPVFEKAHSKQK